MNLIRKSVTALIGATTLFTTLNLFETQPAWARVPCTSSVTPIDLMNSECTTEAVTYGITFYQIGLCTSDPLSTQTPNTSSCFFIFNNSSGQYVDIGSMSGNRTFTLNTLSENEKPIGPYPYFYAVWNNKVLIKGEATISTGRFYTSNTAYINPDPNDSSIGTLGTTNSAEYASYLSPTLQMNDSCFSRNEDVGGNASILTSNNQPTDYNGEKNECTGAAKLAVSARTDILFGSTFIATPTSRGINLQFSTPRSIGLFANSKAPAPGYDYVFDYLGPKISLVSVLGL